MSFVILTHHILFFVVVIFYYVDFVNTYILKYSLVNLVWLITPFTTQIFEFFIASTFIYESIHDLFGPIQLIYSTNELLLNGDDNGDATGVATNTTRDLSTTTTTTTTTTDPNEGGVLERSSAYAGLVIGIGTFYICWVLHFAETWRSFNTATRSILASYNMLISLIVMTSLSYIPGVDQSIEGSGGLVRVDVVAPWDWQPTDVNRNWIVNPFDGITTEGMHVNDVAIAIWYSYLSLSLSLIRNALFSLPPPHSQVYLVHFYQD